MDPQVLEVYLQCIVVLNSAYHKEKSRKKLKHKDEIYDMIIAGISTNGKYYKEEGERTSI